MKFFENKSIFQKITIAILIVTIFSFIFSGNVRAKDGDDGILVKPVMSLLNALGDGVMDVLHSVLLRQTEAALRIDFNGEPKGILGCAIAILIGVAVAVAVVCTAGAVLPAVLGAVASGFAVGILKGITVVTVGLYALSVVQGEAKALGGQMVLPLYNVSPDIIFSGKMSIFDVDFFNPDDSIKTVIDESPETGTAITQATTDKNEIISVAEYNGWKITDSDFEKANKIAEDEHSKHLQFKNEVGKICELSAEKRGDEYYYTLWKITPKTEKQEIHASSAYNLRSTIASWYKTLRNIALVGGLTILVYVGIKIILSSSSADKSKYKQRLMDWLVSMCLIFLMHYIMAGSTLVVGRISKVLNAIDDEKLKGLSAYSFEKDSEIKKVKETIEQNSTSIKNAGMSLNVDEIFPEDELGGKVLVWPTNQMGMIRMKAQEMYTENTLVYVGYTIMFLMLVFFTLFFTVTYFKRILYMAFLTIIAPLVAMTYSLDKLKDGKAQGFSMWFREYIVNLIIQPIHLLLYTILISSAQELAAQNVLYGIVALGFLVPAEKLVRKFFGVPSTETQGFLQGPAGAALTMTGLNKLLGHRPPKIQEKEDKKEDKDAINFKKASLDPYTIFGASEGADSGMTTSGTTLGAASSGLSSSGVTRNRTLGGKRKNRSGTQSGASTPGRGSRQASSTSRRGNRPVSSTSRRNNITGARTGNSGTVLKTTGSTALSSRTPTLTAPRTYLERLQGIKKDDFHWGGDGENKRQNSRARGLKNVFGTGIRKAGRKIVSPKNGKFLLKGALGIGARFAGAGVALGAGTVAAAVGATSGDMSKTFQYAAGAGLAGYKAGTATGNFINTINENSANIAENAGKSARELYEEGYYGKAADYYENSRDRELEKRARETINNDEWISKYARITNKTIPEARRHVMDNIDFLKEGIGYGLGEANEFAAAEKARDDYSEDILPDKVNEHSYKMVKLAKIQSSKLTDSADSAKTKNDLLDSYAERINPNVDSNDPVIRSKARRMLEQLQEINDIYTKT